MAQVLEITFNDYSDNIKKLNLLEFRIITKNKIFKNIYFSLCSKLQDTKQMPIMEI